MKRCDKEVHARVDYFRVMAWASASSDRDSGRVRMRFIQRALQYSQHTESAPRNWRNVLISNGMPPCKADGSACYIQDRGSGCRGAVCSPPAGRGMRRPADPACSGRTTGGRTRVWRSPSPAPAARHMHRMTADMRDAAHGPQPESGESRWSYSSMRGGAGTKARNHKKVRLRDRVPAALSARVRLSGAQPVWLRGMLNAYAHQNGRRQRRLLHSNGP